MHADIQSSWNALVAPDDEVWHLGDYAMGNVRWGLDWLANLHGVHTIVLGNHDKPWAGKKSDPTWREEFKLAFAEVHDGPIDLSTAFTKYTGAPVSVLANHFPFAEPFPAGKVDKYAAHRHPVPHGGWLLHGHSHGRWRQRGRMIDVGIDAWGGKPVPATAIAALFEQGPADSDRVPWERE